jgi:hypothetical protein
MITLAIIFNAVLAADLDPTGGYIDWISKLGVVGILSLLIILFYKDKIVTKTSHCLQMAEVERERDQEKCEKIEWKTQFHDLLITTQKNVETLEKAVDLIDGIKEQLLKGEVK